MSKDDQKIIVVERDILLGDNYFQGFRPAAEFDYESKILSNMKVMRRGDAETDPTHKQPIGYCIVTINNKKLGKNVVAYQRSSKGGEQRLHEKWAWGFGGHIEPSDTGVRNPIKESLMREVVDEELLFENALIRNPKVIGYINDDLNEVGKFHFGILYNLDIYTESVKPRDHEIARIKLCSVGELEEMCLNPEFNVENWSRIAMEPLRKLL